MDVKELGATTQLKPSNFTVTTTAAQIPTTNLATRRAIYIFNNASAGGSTIFIGDSTVTSSNGTPIPPQTSMTIQIAGDLKIFAVTSSSAADTRVLELA